MTGELGGLIAIAASPTLRGWLMRGWHVWRAVRQSRAYGDQ